MALSRSPSRRTLLRSSIAAAALVSRELLPAGAAASPVVDPYTGAIPLVFPLKPRTYQTPLQDNWHVSREGSPLEWSHRTSRVFRAHDGVDVYPLPGAPLPTVYAPLAAQVAAVRVGSSYQVAGTPPPWNYSTSPIYGNFVWLRSTEAASAGYFVFVCHLQDEAAIRGLAAGQPISTGAAIGVVGGTGSATGAPQLHLEIHYPAGQSFGCRRCTPRKTLTAINPYASLVNGTNGT